MCSHHNTLFHVLFDLYNTVFDVQRPSRRVATAFCALQRTRGSAQKMKFETMVNQAMI